LLLLCDFLNRRKGKTHVDSGKHETTEPKFAGSNPAEAVGFFKAGKKKSSARLPSEGK
jgi:hypothetical protein